MSTETVQSEPASSHPMNYVRAFQLARRLVVEEANSRGRELSHDELEFKAARRAAEILRA
jgi:hypothetical protein